jgi:hypothetical protein
LANEKPPLSRTRSLAASSSVRIRRVHGKAGVGGQPRNVPGAALDVSSLVCGAPSWLAFPRCRLLARVICLVGRKSGFYFALIYLLGLAGLRPSEAYHLRLKDLELPNEGWGIARVRGGTPTPGRRCTGGSAHSDEAIKTAVTDSVKRTVPLSPDVVMALRCHIELARNAGVRNVS